jgi:hypothetical protein
VSELWKYLGDEASSIDSGIWVMRFFNWDQTHQGVNLYQLRSKERQDESQVEFIQRLDPDMLTESGGYLVPQKPTYILVDRANSEAVALLVEFQPKMEAQVVWHHNRPGGFPGLEVWEILAFPPDTI